MPSRLRSATVAPVVVAAALLLAGGAAHCGPSQAAARLAGARCPAGSLPADSEATTCLSRLEVTVDEYAACITAGRCTARAKRAQCNGERGGVGGHPANCLNQAQAERYCDWAGGRLPTSDEWERAARPALPRIEHGQGVDPPADICWNDRSGKVGTCTVGSFCMPGSICDLAGNVAEWTSTVVDLPGGKRHAIVRGGGWIFDPLTYAAELEPTFKRRADPASRLVDVGFRCAFERRGAAPERTPN